MSRFLDGATAADAEQKKYSDSLIERLTISLRELILENKDAIDRSGQSYKITKIINGDSLHISISAPTGVAKSRKIIVPGIATITLTEEEGSYASINYTEKREPISAGAQQEKVPVLTRHSTVKGERGSEYIKEGFGEDVFIKGLIDALKPSRQASVRRGPSSSSLPSKVLAPAAPASASLAPTSKVGTGGAADSATVDLAAAERLAAEKWLLGNTRYKKAIREVKEQKDKHQTLRDNGYDVIDEVGGFSIKKGRIGLKLDDTEELLFYSEQQAGYLSTTDAYGDQKVREMVDAEMVSFLTEAGKAMTKRVAPAPASASATLSPQPLSDTLAIQAISSFLQENKSLIQNTNGFFRIVFLDQNRGFDKKEDKRRDKQLKEFYNNSILPFSDEVVECSVKYNSRMQALFLEFSSKSLNDEGLKTFFTKTALEDADHLKEYFAAQQLKSAAAAAPAPTRAAVTAPVIVPAPAKAAAPTSTSTSTSTAVPAAATIREAASVPASAQVPVSVSVPSSAQVPVSVSVSVSAKAAASTPASTPAPAFDTTGEFELGIIKNLLSSSQHSFTKFLRSDKVPCIDIRFQGEGNINLCKALVMNIGGEAQAQVLTNVVGEVFVRVDVKSLQKTAVKEFFEGKLAELSGDVRPSLSLRAAARTLVLPAASAPLPVASVPPSGVTSASRMPATSTSTSAPAPAPVPAPVPVPAPALELSRAVAPKPSVPTPQVLPTVFAEPTPPAPQSTSSAPTPLSPKTSASIASVATVSAPAAAASAAQARSRYPAQNRSVRVLPQEEYPTQEDSVKMHDPSLVAPKPSALATPPSAPSATPKTLEEKINDFFAENLGLYLNPVSANELKVINIYNTSSLSKTQEAQDKELKITFLGLILKEPEKFSSHISQERNELNDFSWQIAAGFDKIKPEALSILQKIWMENQRKLEAAAAEAAASLVSQTSPAAAQPAMQPSVAAPSPAAAPAHDFIKMTGHIRECVTPAAADVFRTLPGDQKRKILDETVVTITEEEFEHARNFLALIAETGGQHFDKGHLSQKSVYENAGILPQNSASLGATRDEIKQGITAEHVKKLYQRFLTKRAKYFYRVYDKFSAREDAPLDASLYQDHLQAKDYLLYSELELSAMLAISGPTHFINNGNRVNSGKLGQAGTYEKSGYIYALVGARLETRDPSMERLHVVKGEYEKMAEGSAGNQSLGRIKGVSKEFVKGYKEIYDSFYTKDSRFKDGSMDLAAIRCRLRMSYVKFIYDAINNAKANGTKAFIRIVGIGDGVWSGDFDSEVGRAIGESVRQVINSLNPEQKTHIYALQFCDYGGKGGYQKVFNEYGGEGEDVGIKVLTDETGVFSNKLPSLDSREEQVNRELFVNFAYDSNCRPGNELHDLDYRGRLVASGDPAAACCSAITVSQSAELNPGLLERINVLRRDGKVVSILKHKPADKIKEDVNQSLLSVLNNLESAGLTVKMESDGAIVIKGSVEKFKADKTLDQERTGQANALCQRLNVLLQQNYCGISIKGNPRELIINVASNQEILYSETRKHLLQMRTSKDLIPIVRPLDYISNDILTLLGRNLFKYIDGSDEIAIIVKATSEDDLKLFERLSHNANLPAAKDRVTITRKDNSINIKVSNTVLNDAVKDYLGRCGLTFSSGVVKPAAPDKTPMPAAPAKAATADANANDDFIAIFNKILNIMDITPEIKGDKISVVGNVKSFTGPRLNEVTTRQNKAFIEELGLLIEGNQTRLGSIFLYIDEKGQFNIGADKKLFTQEVITKIELMIAVKKAASLTTARAASASSAAPAAATPAAYNYLLFRNLTNELCLRFTSKEQRDEALRKFKLTSVPIANRKDPLQYSKVNNCYATVPYCKDDDGFSIFFPTYKATNGEMAVNFGSSDNMEAFSTTILRLDKTANGSDRSIAGKTICSKFQDSQTLYFSELGVSENFYHFGLDRQGVKGCYQDFQGREFETNKPYTELTFYDKSVSDFIAGNHSNSPEEQRLFHKFKLADACSQTQLLLEIKSFYIEEYARQSSKAVVDYDPSGPARRVQRIISVYNTPRGLCLKFTSKEQRDEALKKFTLEYIPDYCENYVSRDNVLRTSPCIIEDMSDDLSIFFPSNIAGNSEKGVFLGSDKNIEAFLSILGLKEMESLADDNAFQCKTIIDGASKFLLNRYSDVLRDSNGDSVPNAIRTKSTTHLYFTEDFFNPTRSPSTIEALQFDQSKPGVCAQVMLQSPQAGASPSSATSQPTARAASDISPDVERLIKEAEARLFVEQRGRFKKRDEELRLGSVMPSQSVESVKKGLLPLETNALVQLKDMKSMRDSIRREVEERFRAAATAHTT